MKHYTKTKYPKKLTLFSKDAVKSIDNTGYYYNSCKWNNIPNLDLITKSKLKVSNFHFLSDKLGRAILDTDLVAPISTDNLTLWYKFENNVNDSSDNNINGTLDGSVGLPTYNTSIVKRGTYSIYFGNNNTNGNRHSIIIEENGNKLYQKLGRANNTIGMTFSFWFYRTSALPNEYPRLFFANDNAETSLQNNCIQISISGSNGPINFIVNKNGIASSLSTTTNMSYNVWTHITVVIKAESTNLDLAEHSYYIYINGILNNSRVKNSYYPNITETNNAYIGRWRYLNTNYRDYSGYLDDFRIYNKPLNATEISTILGSLSEFEQPLCHFKFDGNLDDSVGNAIVTKLGGNDIIYTSTVKKRGITSCKIVPPINYRMSNILKGKSIFSICYWIYFNTGSQQPFILNDPNYLQLRFFANSTALYIGTTGTLSYSTPFVYASNYNKWIHFVWTVNMNTQTVGCFINGVVSTTTINGTWTLSSIGGLDTTQFLSRNSSTNNCLNGYVDDFRIYDKVLDIYEVREVIYDKELYIWYKFEDDQDTMKTTLLTPEFGAFMQSTIKKIDRYSLDLTSSNKGVSLTLQDTTTNVFFNATQLSICFWSFLTSTTPTTQKIFTQYGFFSVYLDFTTDRLYIVLGTRTIYFTVTSLLNVWTHFTIYLNFDINSTDKIRLYLNGVSQTGTLGGTELTDVFYPSNTNKLYIGSDDGLNNGFNGYIDDIRIYTTIIDPSDILEIMYVEISSVDRALYKIKCPDIYDTYNSDYKNPVIFHSKGVSKNKTSSYPSFKINAPINSLTLDINYSIDGNFVEKPLNIEDDFLITLTVEDDDDNNYKNNNIIEPYSKLPQYYINY